MKINIRKPPRTFKVGLKKKIELKDYGTICLEPDEQITFLTDNNNEYDLARKSFGFYATPSLNGRLLKYNFRAVLVKNSIHQYYIMLVEKGKEDLFYNYIKTEKQNIICWLDNNENLEKIRLIFNK